MSFVACLRLALTGDTMFPLCAAPFFLATVGEPGGSPTPLPLAAHESTEGAS
jgi:hypothetical protein